MSSDNGPTGGVGEIEASSLQSALVRWLLDQTHQGMFATDRQFQIVVWNRWMEVHSEKPAGDVIGRCLFDVYPNLLERGIDEYYRSALQGRFTVVSHGLHRHLLPLAPTMPELAFKEMPQTGRIGPLLAGEVIGTVTTIEDVSERLAAEAELRKQIEAQRLARTTAEKALRVKDEFLSTLSHELRSPLSAILGWTRVLLARRDVEPEVLSRALQAIERNAAAQATMIDDMLDIARVAAGKLRIDLQPVDLVNVVLAAVDVVAPSAEVKGLSIRTSLDSKMPSVLGDPARLQQIVGNLLSNALKFTDPGGTIAVEVTQVEQLARLVVRDTGRGIRTDFLPFVFDRFSQSDASSARRQGGLGLGLALVRELVEIHGGTIRAESAGENEGAAFIIELPVAPSPQLRTRGEDNSSSLEAPSLAGIRVLIVDDEADARYLTAVLLEHFGAEVTTVGSSAEALAAIREVQAESRPHVLLSDVGMPDEDGYNLIRKVRALAPDCGGAIPAISLTGYATPDDINRALAAGYGLHLAKPVDPRALAAAIVSLAAPSISPQ